MEASPRDEGAAQVGLHCENCTAPLAHDQRYCVECGTRRGPLPAPIAQTLGAILEQGREIEPPGRAPDPPPSELEDGAGEPNRWSPSRPLGPSLPTPRVAAMGVLGMLAFGVVVGSLAGGGFESLAAVPQIVLNLGGGGGSGSASGGGGAGGSGGGGGGSGGQQTITQTVGSSGAAAGGGGSSGGGGGGGSSGGGGNTTTGFNGLPPVKHMFLIMLSEQGFNQSFGPAATDKYLSKTLERQGELVQNYYAVAGDPLANQIALLSGQGPTRQTEGGCTAYSEIGSTGLGSHKQVLGDGCVYPSSTKTLADQLTAKHDTWKAYVEGMPKSCDHPAVGGTIPASVTTKKPYSVTGNPFVFFNSVTKASSCAKDDVAVTKLKADLAKASSTPTFSYIVPSPCDDGRDQPCAPGAPTGLGPAMTFLQKVIPAIERSPAYKSNGLITITFDQAPQSGPHADPSSCCSNPTYPNLPVQPGATTTTPTTSTPTTTTTTSTTTTTGTTTTGTTTAPTTTTSTTPTTTTPSTGLGAGASNPTGGGGQVGMLLISPYVKRNSLDTLDYFNHFALLGGIENLFGLGRLGYAKSSSLLVWSSSVFNAGL
jgi:hypothetical protein